MTAELPEDARRYGEWLSSLSEAELARVIVDQYVDDPEMGEQLAAIRAEDAWSATVELADSLDNDADFIEVPLVRSAFLDALVEDEDVAGVVRLNAFRDAEGTSLDVNVVVEGRLKPGMTIRCSFDADGDDVVLRASELNQLSGRGHTLTALGAADAVTLRLVAEEDNEAIA